ncbi:hypothetical protein HDU96_006796 [Phlyctochytrium bullatum]|nr:hypothetical protein HDU96_006796 [Phlyctochytrium bullatum]
MDDYVEMRMLHLLDQREEQRRRKRLARQRLKSIYTPQHRINWMSITDATAERHFRFTKTQLQSLPDLLRLPEVIIARNNH